MNALIARINAYLATTLPDNIDAHATGTTPLIAAALDDVSRGQIASLSLAVVPILSIMIVAFRSVSVGLIALLPNALPLVVFFGALGWLGIPLNLSTSLVACVVLGIAVDDTIHLFARLRQNVTNGHWGQAAIERTLDELIQPVTLTSAGLAAGFCTLSFATLKSQAEFGLLAAGTLIFAWLLDLSFTPALAWRCGLAGPRK